jgi:bacillopeptidase F
VADEESLDIAAATASGFVTHGRFSVTVDHAAPVITFEDELPRLTANASLTLRGRLSKPATLTLNGQKVTLRDGAFDELLTLGDGDNSVELVATDAAGHVTVNKASVRLARDPPQLLSSSMRADTSGEGGAVSVEIAAADAVGLASSAKVTMLAGGASYEGYLRLNAATNTYQGSVSVPKAALKQARLGNVVLTDNAGNAKTYRLN